MTHPSISVIIPTLNAAKVLGKCLQSIELQDYPKNKIEIIIADGGSTDQTIPIAHKYKSKIISNPLKTGESGKAIGIKHAKGKLIALIDSDNILPNNKWFSQMIKPFENNPIILSEPWEYTYRKSDPWLTRYFALLGMNDPLCLFIGNYDRIGVLHNGWSSYNFKEINHSSWIEANLSQLPIPTIGANGTIIKKSALAQINIGNYYFDIDIPIMILKLKGSINIAKVKTGIIHTFVEDNPNKFFRKQWRRIKDYGYHQKNGSRTINWTQDNTKYGIINFILSCILIIPILWQTLKGLWKSKDWCFIFHPIACYSTLFINVYGVINNKFITNEASRKNWKQ